ncbi:hypothetical protein KKR91_01145 [Arthrobacter jiangjiafuii]|uniref:Uncharacterized protein n=2 Tax=Arthrobacter jiangjiafuii TaxID=2817475 RepID=A0A975M5M6_9MICC|nr:hypothetical protein [Arthrobacter jiangjiafuii]MBP3044887.1 hypothetical protein [Arthrobacter jiangjiafuii]QWC10290.1 hypothetical protein KKR91_01145 [Arthrobacter jiangjiafuii]
MTVYKGIVPKTPTFPYVLLSTNFPTVVERAQSRMVQARELRVRTTVVGESVQSVRIIGQKLSDALEGARPVVAGWSLGRVESRPNDQDIVADRDVTLANGLNPVYAVMDWVLTASRTA